MAQKSISFQTRYKIIHRTEEKVEPRIERGIAEIRLDSMEVVEPIIEFKSLCHIPHCTYFIECPQQQANVRHYVREITPEKIVWELTNMDEDKSVVIKLHYQII